MNPKPHTLYDLDTMPWEQVTDQFQRKLVTGSACSGLCSRH